MWAWNRQLKFWSSSGKVFSSNSNVILQSLGHFLSVIICKNLFKGYHHEVNPQYIYQNGYYSEQKSEDSNLLNRTRELGWENIWLLSESISQVYHKSQYQIEVRKKMWAQTTKLKGKLKQNKKSLKGTQFNLDWKSADF